MWKEKLLTNEQIKCITIKLTFSIITEHLSQLLRFIITFVIYYHFNGCDLGGASVVHPTIQFLGNKSGLIWIFILNFFFSKTTSNLFVCADWMYETGFSGVLSLSDVIKWKQIRALPFDGAIAISPCCVVRWMV